MPPPTPPLTVQTSNAVTVRTFPPSFLKVGSYVSVVKATQEKQKLVSKDCGVKRKQDDEDEEESDEQEAFMPKKKQKGAYHRTVDPPAYRIETTHNFGESLRPAALKGKDLRNSDGLTDAEKKLRKQYFAKLRQRVVTMKKKEKLKKITEERDYQIELNKKLMDELAELRASDDCTQDNRLDALQKKYDELSDVHAQLKRDFEALKTEKATQEVSQILANDFPNSPRKNRQQSYSRMLALRDSIENGSPCKEPIFGTVLDLENMSSSELQEPLTSLSLDCPNPTFSPSIPRRQAALFASYDERNDLSAVKDLLPLNLDE